MQGKRLHKYYLSEYKYTYCTPSGVREQGSKSLTCCYKWRLLCTIRNTGKQLCVFTDVVDFIVVLRSC